MSELILVPPSTKKNFDFVDTIRCISMMGIVFEHSAVLWGIKFVAISDQILQIATMQFFKFATIAFFLIGGFLINYKFTEYTPAQYIQRRFTNTIKPWLFWIMILVIANLIREWVVFKKGMGSGEFLEYPVAYFVEQFRYILFESSFWFILNFLICISLLLIFKRFLYKPWFGLILFSISLIYSVNLYAEWFVTRHSIALFGFVFYLWLGVNLNRYYDRVMLWVKHVSWPVMLMGNTVFFILACAEVYVLTELGSHDEYNTLRITNIFYSFSMFALMLKMGDIKSLDQALTPRKSTFGIYLIHQLLIIRLLPEIFKIKVFIAASSSVYMAIGYSFLRFATVYLLSFTIAKLILRTRFKWIVGN